MTTGTDTRELGLDSEDPYPGYRWLRAHQPVAWSGEAEGWLVSRYDDVVAVLKDFEAFRQVPFFPGGQRFVFDIDEPAHRPARRVYTAGASFAGSSLAERIGAEMGSTAGEVVAALAADRFDGLRDLAVPAVVKMIGQLFELPAPEDSRIDWATSLEGTYPDPTSERGAAELAFVEDVIAARRKSPGADPFSKILGANEAARAVGDEEVAWEIWDMIFAGGHSTVDQAGLALNALASAAGPAPGDCFGDDTTAKRAVEELLRFAPHVHCVKRSVACQREVAGVTLREGEIVYALLASANRDEAHWEDPDALDLRREGGPPILTFGTGIHTTPGATFVRMTLVALFTELFRRFDRLRPAGRFGRDDVTAGGLVSLACPCRLPLRG